MNTLLHSQHGKIGALLFPTHPLGLCFTEVMTGYFSESVKGLRRSGKDMYKRGFEEGQKEGTSCELKLKIIFADARQFPDAQQRYGMLGTANFAPCLEYLYEHGLKANICGEAIAPKLSPYPLKVSGEFLLFAADAKKAGARFLFYKMILETDERAAERDGDGNRKKYYCLGEKEIGRSDGFLIWSAFTTLRLTLYNGETEKAPLRGAGILKVHFGDFLMQLASLRATETHRLADHLQAITDFVQFFGDKALKTVRRDLDKRLQKIYKVLVVGAEYWWKRLWFDLVRYWRTYGKLVADTVEFLYWRLRPQLLRRQTGGRVWGKRFPVRLSSGPCLYLTRYRGGRKGPVLLVPGYGMASDMFVIDTVDRSLAAYLCDHGYEVWLFDYRASDRARDGLFWKASETQFTVDDIAVEDYPAAIDLVLKKTNAVQPGTPKDKAKKVQVMAHCAGSMTFLMAMLADENNRNQSQGGVSCNLSKKIRSAICSQVTLFPDAGHSTEMKAALHVAAVLDVLNVKTFAAGFDWTSWADAVLEVIFRRCHTHEVPCSNQVCRRILFLYGETHRHVQLDYETHRKIGKLFGSANMRSLRQFSLMMRRDQIVDKDGRDVYLPHVDRLKFPITFLHGAENKLFLPSGSEKTYRLLCEKNGRRYYSRYVIPDYAHLDCFIGKHAARDVFPLILEELEKHN